MELHRMMESITASSNLVASQMGVLTDQQVQQSTDSIVSSLALQIRAVQDMDANDAVQLTELISGTCFHEQGKAILAAAVSERCNSLSLHGTLERGQAHHHMCN